MLQRTLVAFGMSMLLFASMPRAEAAANSDLAAGQMCATRLYVAAHGKSPELLLQNAGKLVNFDHVISTAAALNGDALSPPVMAKYKEGMADFAKHFVIPHLADELKHVPHITVATRSGNTLIISEGGDSSLTIEQRSCRIINARGAGVSLVSMLAKHIKANFS